MKQNNLPLSILVHSGFYTKSWQPYRQITQQKKRHQQPLCVTGSDCKENCPGSKKTELLPAAGALSGNWVCYRSLSPLCYQDEYQAVGSWLYIAVRQPFAYCCPNGWC